MYSAESLSDIAENSERVKAGGGGKVTSIGEAAIQASTLLSSFEDNELGIALIWRLDGAMIQMQRSLSLPGPAHASPLYVAVSPTITHVSSRSPTPSPPNHQILPPPRLLLHRHRSRSPPRPPTAYKERPLETDKNRQTSRERSAEEPKPDAQKAPSEPNPAEPESPPPASKLPPLPLIQDVSQYVDNHIIAVAAPPATTTLDELAHFARLSTYQAKKRTITRIRLQRSLVSTAISARLARCGELAHRTLVDNFRADEKSSFTNLYNAIHDVRNSCDATRRYALLDPDLDAGKSTQPKGDDSGSLSTFIHKIPQRSREALLGFLTQVRTNPDFLASRISSLSSSELSALTVFHQGLEPIDSVLPFHTRSKGHVSNLHRSPANIPSPVERLLSFQRHDPLSALIHTCFANSAGPDSVEDLRRTDVWAATCARLITESKSGTDPFICSVLNVWTAMRDWSGRTNMEWYLMKILEDGAFLLEKAEDQAGTRIHVEPRNAKDSIAAEEFYDSAIEGLFKIVDDPGAGGIPEGLIELGNAILKKLDQKRHGPTRRFLVSKWLFSVFLLNVIIHPESYGMMAEYHITEYGRQKILKEVAMRAQRLVVDMTWNKSPSTPLAIKGHIENILTRFRASRSSRGNAKLLPARSITSLRETVEVHPYLVLSPADLLTMVNALFPERRPSSGSLPRDIHRSGLRSTASSISGISAISASMPIPGARGAFDNVSVISTSGESVISDITQSREPLLDDVSSVNPRFSTASTSPVGQSHSPNFNDDDGFEELRAALYDLTQLLGPDGVSGSCHPCAENWAVLFVSPDGKELSTQMIQDHNDEAEEEDSTSNSESDDEGFESRPDLDKDYHQLRNSILKLVEEYDIPQTLGPKTELKTFSNRTSVLENPRKKNRTKTAPTKVEIQSKNPYRVFETSKEDHAEQTLSKGSNDTDSTKGTDEQPPMLVAMLEAAERQCQAQSDFVNAHLYWKTLNQLHQITSPSLKKDGFASLLNIFARGPRDSIRRSTSAIEEYDAWLVWLKQSQERHDITIESMMKRLKALRDKMWYVTDVRNSAAYEGARNVAVALKSMVSQNNKYMSRGVARPRNTSKSAANSFLFRTEVQIMDMMAAPEDQGGPNKLSDDQSEKTLRWLSQFGIENFCKGEERIHRFCLEVETCISKLVGDNLMDGPVLWSSELYYRDKRLLDNGKQKGDSFLIGALNLSGDEMGEVDTGRRGMRTTDFSRPGTRDLRSISARNTSQQSFDSGRYSMSRMSAAGDLMDSQDYFGMASPVLTIDSTTTFWSPFQTRSQSPVTSLGSHRPDTASSTNETVTMKEERASLSKQHFLSDLKQTLTSLLVSDLGTLVFARGSETDAWFSSDLGNDCMEIREQRELRERKVRKKIKKRDRVIEKKKSFRDLRGVHKPDHMSDRSDEHGERMEKVRSRNSMDRATPDPPHSTADSSSTTSETTRGSRKSLSQEVLTHEFPYRKAFKRLLRMFSVHPNPYAKLNALYELEHLIIAYLTPSAPRRTRSRQDVLTSSPSQSPEVQHMNAFGSSDGVAAPRAKNLEEAIDSCKGRRSLITNQPESTSPTHRNSDRSLAAPSPASTDMIVDVLQDLFRDSDIRPKTLFRDLQFIASFVPAAVLDKTERGKAFWDAGLAALGLKQDVCRTLIEIADEIVVHYTQTRKVTSHSSGDNSQISTTSGELMKYSMEDAAKMWTITAKEGDPVAERELAIFYLTHPELVERVTAPLSKPRDTFKAQVMEMHQGKEGVVNERDRERSDPATMCVAYHWMELSAVGGDELAKKYLRQREELNAIP
ncbi:hypothetical protein B7463_g1068, partial [Scytalidium lignicola]